MDIIQEKSNPFSSQQVNNFVALSESLKKIHIRLLHEGYKVVDGKIIPPINKEIAVK